MFGEIMHDVTDKMTNAMYETMTEEMNITGSLSDNNEAQ